MALLGKVRFLAGRWLALFCWRLSHPPGLRPRLTLTYANGLFTDGAGAQLQRIFAIYGLTRLLAVPYKHSPIKGIGYHGLAALEGQGPALDPLPAWNSLLPLVSDPCIAAEAEELLLERPLLWDLLWLSWRARIRRHSLIVNICLPYGIADAYPHGYRLAQSAVSSVVISAPAFTGSAGSSPLRLALHVRRGDLAWYCSDRLLPSSYYLNVAQQITAELLSRGLAFVCELHTELPTRRLELVAGDHGVASDLEHPVVINPEDTDIGDFDVLPNLQRFVNGNPVDSFKRLASADILVISKSSFSYLAALMNPSAMIVYCPFLHPRLRGWLMPDSRGQLDPRRLAKAFDQLLSIRLARSGLS